ncbi:hypothetical protein DICVIV_03474 [Dictyocaulus viviparus]|uniref:Uncharacterized protein n=1 Tax=Dictyocaulus viviparus TaxID=29172 RepID=A0A0D8Y2Z9_DICVI|nr:hypothetical protein DICVIV_03474 [Dictyocaulus viviparus]
MRSFFEVEVDPENDLADLQSQVHDQRNESVGLENQLVNVLTTLLGTTCQKLTVISGNIQSLMKEFHRQIVRQYS